jgi:hypothetical protein
MEAPLVKKKPQTPKIHWKDYFNALVELDNLPYLEKITQSFDVVILATDSFKARTTTEGTVMGMTVEVEGFRAKVSSVHFNFRLVNLSRFWKRRAYC